MTLLPLTAYAALSVININYLLGDQPGDVYDYTYTVGNTVNLIFSTDVSFVPPASEIASVDILAGSLPSGLGLSIAANGLDINLTGTATNATAPNQAATIWAQDGNGNTATRDITFTINKASPAISGSNTLSGVAGSFGNLTATATIASGWFGGTTPNMALTATITDGTNMATGTATATGANVDFDFPAAQLNTLVVGGSYDITVSAFSGNANNNGFAAQKIGTLTPMGAPATSVPTLDPKVLLMLVLLLVGVGGAMVARTATRRVR